MRSRAESNAAKKSAATERTSEMWNEAGSNGATTPSVHASTVPAVLPKALREISCSGADLLSDEDLKPRWVVEGLVEETDTVLFSGEEKKSFKTRSMVDLAIARITGGHWLGFRVECCVPAIVYFVTPESTLGQCKRTFRQLCAGRGIDASKVAPYLHFVTEDTVTVLPLDELNRIETAGRIETIDRTKSIPAKHRDEARTKGFRMAEARANNMGSGVSFLRALYEAEPGSIGMLVFDTVTTCWPSSGKQNDSDAARLYTRGSRDLARYHGCPVTSIHHTGKGAAPGDHRGARGSTELTAGHRVLLTADTSGSHPTLYFSLNGHAAPNPVGYRLVPVVDGGEYATMTADQKALAPMILEPCEAASPRSKKGRAGKGAGLDDDEVLAILRQHAPDALSSSKIRGFISKGRGGKEGSKHNEEAVLGALDRLIENELATKVQIANPRGKSFDGYRAGTDSRPGVAKRIDMNGAGSMDAFLGSATDV